MNSIRNALQSIINSYISFRWKSKVVKACERYGSQANAVQAIFDALFHKGSFFKDSKREFVRKTLAERHVQVVTPPVEAAVTPVEEANPVEVPRPVPEIAQEIAPQATPIAPWQDTLSSVYTVTSNVLSYPVQKVAGWIDHLTPSFEGLLNQPVVERPPVVVQEKKPTSLRRSPREFTPSVREFKNEEAKGMFRTYLTMPFAQSGHQEIGMLVSEKLFPLSQVETFEVSEKSRTEFDFTVTMTADQKTQLSDKGKTNLVLSNMFFDSDQSFEELEKQTEGFANIRNRTLFSAGKLALRFFDISLNKTIKGSVKQGENGTCEVTFEPNQIVGNMGGAKHTLLSISYNPRRSKPLTVKTAPTTDLNKTATQDWSERQFIGVFEDLTW